MTKVLSHKMKIIQQLGSLNDARILDYGCGRGEFIELLLVENQKLKSIHAVDSSVGMIEAIQKSFQKEIINGVVFPKICATPNELSGLKFDKIICQNVLECVDDKVNFINSFDEILSNEGIFILSHHDFDSAIYNSDYKELTRDIVHQFSDAKQDWQEHCDGQMGRKISGLLSSSVFKDRMHCETWRIVEHEFKPGNYGYLMASMITSIVKNLHDPNILELWKHDLEEKAKRKEYYFAIDLVVSISKGKNDGFL